MKKFHSRGMTTRKNSYLNMKKNKVLSIFIENRKFILHVQKMSLRVIGIDSEVHTNMLRS